MYHFNSYVELVDTNSSLVPIKEKFVVSPIVDNLLTDLIVDGPEVHVFLK